MRRVLIATALVTFAILLSQPAAAERVLRLTSQLPVNSTVGLNLVEFKEIVQQRSKGDIKIEIYSSAELYKDDQVLDAVASGAIEMGLVPAGRVTDQVPAFGLLYVPFLFNSIEDVAAATGPGQPIRTALDGELLNKGVRALWWLPFGMAITMGQDQAPLLPGDLKGKKTRVFNETMAKFVQHLGGTPVLVSGSEQRDLYERRAVAFGMTGISAVRTRQLYEVMRYLIETNHAAVEFVVIINEKVWNGLTPAQRAILTYASSITEHNRRLAYAEVNRGDLKWLAQNTDMIVRGLTEQERVAWREAMAPIREEYLGRSGALGKMLIKDVEAQQSPSTGDPPDEQATD